MLTDFTKFMASQTTIKSAYLQLIDDTPRLTAQTTFQTALQSNKLLLLKMVAALDKD